VSNWSSYAALYYPYASFGDERWLRRAVLFWDSVGIIRPPGVQSLLASVGPLEQLMAREEPAFLNLMTPRDEELEPLNTSLIEAHGEEHPWDSLRAEYGPEARATLPASAERPEPAAPVNGDPRLVWIFAAYENSKISYVLADELLQNGLAEESLDANDERWLGLHPRFADIYLTSVAGQMAGNRGLIALTDDADVHRAAGPVELTSIDQALTDTKPGGHGRIRDVEAQYLHIALSEMPKVLDIDEVPAGKLLDFRQEHLPQMRAFRAHLGTLEEELTSLAAVNDPEARQDRLRELYRSETQPQLDELRRSLTRFGFRTAMGTLQLKVDVSASTVAGMAVTTATSAMAGAPAALTGALGLAMAIVPYAVDRHRTRRHHMATSPVSFLLAAERELSKEQALRRMGS